MAWPDYAIIFRDGYSDTPNTPARRTQFDSGAISQKRNRTRAWRTTTFRFAVPESRVADFVTWQKNTGTRQFDFPDLNGTSGTPTMRSVAVVNGAENVTLESVAGRLLNGERYRQGNITLEGYG